MPCSRHHPYHDQDCDECNDEWGDGNSCHSILGWLFVIFVVGAILYLLMRPDKSDSFGCGCSAVRTGAALGSGQPKVVNPEKLNRLLDDLIQ